MDERLIKDKVIGTFRKVFPNEKNITVSTTVDDIKNWDSLNHITLIRELEQQFGMQFDLFEIIEIIDVEGFIRYVSLKMNE